MRGNTTLRAAVALCAAVLVGCTGGGEEVVTAVTGAAPAPAPSQGPATAPVPTPAPAPIPSPVTSAPQAQEVVVRFDRNGDDQLDLLTLDTSDENLKIVSALDGSAVGDPVDVTAVLAGTELDPEIVRSLKTYLANSLEVASETQLDVVDQNGETVTITIFE